MANETIYPFGQNGQLPSSIGVVNDLTTGGADKALSAQQGVVLKGLIDDSASCGVETLLYPCSGALGNYINATSNAWKSSAYTQSFFYPIEPGHRYAIVGGSAQGRYAILKSTTNTVDTTPDYAMGETALHYVNANATSRFTAPSDAYYLSINRTVSGSNVTPLKIIEYLPETSIREQDVDTSIAEIRGTFNNSVVFNDLTVLSNNSQKITIAKDSDGGILVDNVNSGAAGYALIQLPDGLVAGEKYVISFRYQASFNGGASWYLRFVDTSYAETSGGIYLYPHTQPTLVRVNYTHTAANKYLRLASNSQNSGAVAYITELSFSNNGYTIANLSTRIKTLEDAAGNDQLESLLRQARYVATSPTTQPLTLLHFSDIHGDSLAAATIQKFYTAHSSMIDDMVQTGDTVYYYYDSTGQGYQWFQEAGLPQSLFVLGNHDGAAEVSGIWREGSADWDYKGKAWDFDTYFADYIATRGITPPTGYDDSSSPYYKACYWHKDYASAKIRIIGLDCMHFNDGLRYTSDDQETWLAAKLQETLTSGNAAYGYSVVFLCHYPIDDYSGNNETWNESTHKFTYNHNETGGHVMQRSTSVATAFHSGSSYTASPQFSLRNRVGTAGSGNYVKGDDNPLADVIQAWMDNGGKYVAWLSGHTHTEYMYYPAKYPNMLCIGIPQAGNTRGDNSADRSNTSAEHTCANFIVIDTQNNLIKIVRIGKTLNRLFFDQSKICYNYSEKSVYNR